MEPRSIFWKKELKLPGTSWTMTGYSRCAYRTGFYIHGLNIMLDAGPQSFKKPDNIFITHTHGDHIAELPFTMIQEISEEDSKITVYCPEEAKEYVRQYIMQLHNTNSLTDTSANTDSYYNLAPVSPIRTKKRVVLNKQSMELETVAADHNIPTVVYGFSLIKDKLNPAFASLSGKEIAQLKKSGTKVTVEVIEKKFSYVLDTSIKILEDSPFLLEYPVVIIECTFLFDDDIETAKTKMHIHWKELKPYVIQNPNVFFILTHFSLRYRDQEIRSFFENIDKTEGIKNVYPWLTDSIPIVPEPKDLHGFTLPASKDLHSPTLPDSDLVTITRSEFESLKQAAGKI